MLKSNNESELDLRPTFCKYILEKFIQQKTYELNFLEYLIIFKGASSLFRGFDSESSIIKSLFFKKQGDNYVAQVSEALLKVLPSRGYFFSTKYSANNKESRDLLFESLEKVCKGFCNQTKIKMDFFRQPSNDSRFIFALNAANYKKMVEVCRIPFVSVSQKPEVFTIENDEEYKQAVDKIEEEIPKTKAEMKFEVCPIKKYEDYFEGKGRNLQRKQQLVTANQQKKPNAQEKYPQIKNERLLAYIDSMLKKSETFGDLFEKLELDAEKICPNYVCPILLDVPNIPVLLCGDVYDLDSLIGWYERDNSLRLLPTDGKTEFKLNDLQEGRLIVNDINKIIKEKSVNSKTEANGQKRAVVEIEKEKIKPETEDNSTGKPGFFSTTKNMQKKPDDVKDDVKCEEKSQKVGN